ncbi:dihydroxyacetone kinase transcriptional activator DhaS [Loigolactobacillus zhaoyuanensis]|uniref:Dihydroxyacetone kinase transcriptional activator DhaS n=1 Tax=Loigolactobacillus zhaoyuanensis TaxID=2486017 RepID=A0ABW8UDU1_9LACO|nr:dihydroxyacetone kinase transcriptional activator DhaS [Loigolactobacillus zhaoyuanensis]
MPSTTQQQIATALKALMLTTSFNQINVTLIMQQAQLRRQTFYEYFQDKYDLLAWIFSSEAGTDLEASVDYEHWTSSLLDLLNYLEDNRSFYRNALAISEQNSFDQYFLAHTKQLTDIIVRDLLKTKNIPLTGAYISFLREYFSRAVVSVIVDWLQDEQPNSPQYLSQQLQTVIEDTISGFLQRVQ